MQFGGAAIVLIAGCYNPTIRAGAPCESDRECPGPLKCVQNVCGGTEATIDAPAAMPDMFVTPDATIDALNVATHVIGDDASELRDAELFAGTEASTNYGSQDHFSIDADESGVLWFDLTAIPTGKTVMAAMLTVRVGDNASETGGTATIHRLREAWVESEVTWLSRASMQAWGVSGARSPSSDVTPVATFMPMAVDTEYEVALPVQMVQEWIDNPAINYGLVFIQGTATEHVHMATRESGAWSKITIDAY